MSKKTLVELIESYEADPERFGEALNRRLRHVGMVRHAGVIYAWCGRHYCPMVFVEADIRSAAAIDGAG